MNTVLCPVCYLPLAVRLAKGRKSGKPFVMLVCAKDGRHIRAFVSDREFVDSVIEKAGIRTDDSHRAATDTGNEGG